MKIPLGELCRINMGQSPDSSTYNQEKRGLPFYQGNADFGPVNPTPRVWCSAPVKIAHPNDILFSVRAPIGEMNIANETCCIGRGLAAITVDDSKCEPRYIWYCLESRIPDLVSQGTGSTFKAINRGILANAIMKMTPRSNQKKIVKVLDTVNSLIALHETQLTKLDELVKARFVEMFGDFKINSIGWPVVSFEEIAVIDGNMTTDYEKYAEYPHIGIDSIEKETGLLKGYRTVAEDGVVSGKYVFTPSHIIYSKIRPNLNKVALPDFEGLCSADAYPILPIEGKCNRVFLAYNMRSSFFLDYILQFCSRTNLPKVNRKEVAGFKTPLPPIDLQNQFASFVAQVNKSKDAVQRGLDKLETLKKALMQEYFG